VIAILCATIDLLCARADVVKVSALVDTSIKFQNDKSNPMRQTKAVVRKGI
jgi:hypothetical protein